MDPRNFFGGGGDHQQQQQQQQYQHGDLPPELLQWHQQQQNPHFPQQQPMQSYATFPSIFQQQQQQQQQQEPFMQQDSASPTSLTQVESSSTSSPSASNAGPPKKASQAGPVRSKTKSEKASKDTTADAAGSGGGASGGDESSKAGSSKAGAGGASGKSAPSRCNGQQPCHNCINRGREDDCVYTPKPNQSQEEANLEQHLKRLFNLSQMPSQLLEAQREQGAQQFSSASPSQQPQQQHQQQAPPAMPLAGSPLSPIPMVPQSPSGSSHSWDPMAAFYAANLGQSPFSTGSSAVPQQHGVMSPTMGGPMSPWSMDLSGSAATPVTAPPHAVPGSFAGTLAGGGGVAGGDHLYRFLPVFLPPDPESPFILSLQAILPLLSHGEAHEDAENAQVSSSSSASVGADRKQQLLQVAAFYERRASEAIEAVLERAEGHLANGKTDSVTSQGSTLGVIQALAVLCVYHYGSGRALKARLKADQALGLCMAKGLHRLKRPESGDFSSSSSSSSIPATKSSFVAPDNDPFGHQSLFMDMPDVVLYEMQKRVWWTCWSSSLWCAYNTAIVPTIRADDPRVRTEVPATSDSGAWAANVKSLQLLLLIQERVLALSNGKELDEGGSGNGNGSSNGGGQHTRDESKSSTYAPSSNGGDAATPTNSSSTAEPAFHSLPSNATRQDILDSMMDIDRNLQAQIAAIESDESAFKQLCEEPEAIASSVVGRGDYKGGDDSPEALSRRLEKQLVAYLRRSAAIQVYTSSLTLHLGQAFQGATLFERKLCFLNTIGENDSSAACQVPMPDSFSAAFSSAQGGGEEEAAKSAVATAVSNAAQANVATASTQDLFARGPFLPRESLDRCVHASKRLLEIARHRRGPTTPSKEGEVKREDGTASGGDADAAKAAAAAGLSEPNPFNACSFVLISFTLLMQALAVSSGSQDATGGGEEEVGKGDQDYAGSDMDEGEGQGGSFAYTADAAGNEAGPDSDFDMDEFLSSTNNEDGPPSISAADDNDFASSGRRPSNQGRSHSSADVDAFSRGLLQSAQGAAALGGGGGSAVASGSGTPLQGSTQPQQTRRSLRSLLPTLCRRAGRFHLLLSSSTSSSSREATRDLVARIRGALYAPRAQSLLEDGRAHGRRSELVLGDEQDAIDAVRPPSLRLDGQRILGFHIDQFVYSQYNTVIVRHLTLLRVCFGACELE
ncbi:hypothetical protein BDZ90DRAFT_233657 [Jaminaea rosea]|uniref:Xylanolytic transcriptional activator regulatory domain-containing protein n=1 Tax=Jaminaea rosea TaxID=1569628 RepID=A0A316ULA6_9BASI|nr:hypothetical protein BDZ90DRAFT_233657 [Jaminaea rosea]PWN26072.1 hypothetical protein BDZ90DRAFT_233657 [Jaminaea rosea]